MAQIPALFVGSRPQGPEVRNGWFDRAVPVPDGPGIPFREAASAVPRGGPDRSPVMVCDCTSLASRTLVPDVLKTMKVRGHDIWFMTWVEDADDLFDSFNTTAELVVGPYHASSSDADLKDMLSVSDSFIPAVFVSGGCAVLRKGAAGSPEDALAGLEHMGFDRICVVDTDGTLRRGILDPEVHIPFFREFSEDYPGDQIAPLRISPDI